MKNLKKRIVKGQIVASSNPLRDHFTRTFTIITTYSENPLGYKTKSVTFIDKQIITIKPKRNYENK